MSIYQDKRSLERAVFLCYYAIMTIQELLQLAGEQGKVVVVDEQGELKAVLLSGQDYQKLSGDGPTKTVEDETEVVNREILRAQLEEVMALPGIVQPMEEPIERIDSLLARRAEDLFRSIPAADSAANPYTNFSPPDVNTIDDSSRRSSTEAEEIKPNFDDI